MKNNKDLKKYEKPTIERYGDVTEITKGTGAGTEHDGGPMWRDSG